MNSYIKAFLQLRSSGDVLNAVTPVNNLEKEITEAMGIRTQLRVFALSNPMKYGIIDLCAGNGLTGILAVFTLPVSGAMAVDINLRSRDGYKSVNRWNYFQEDIYKLSPDTIPLDTILVSSHACKELAIRSIELFLSSNAHALIILPCCISKERIEQDPTLFSQLHISKYDRWSFKLYSMLKFHNTKVKLFKDKKILSPCNNVIVAEKVNV